MLLLVRTILKEHQKKESWERYEVTERVLSEVERRIQEDVPVVFDKAKVMSEIQRELDQATYFDQTGSAVAHDLDLEFVRAGGLE